MKAALVAALLATPAAAFVAPGARRTRTGRAAVSMAMERGAGRGLFEDITETVGNTPVVKINDRMCPPGRTIYAKCEYFNPLSSVKDRLALAIIEDAESKGLLKPGGSSATSSRLRRTGSSTRRPPAR